jgi:2-isopropylmalate synthase
VDVIEAGFPAASPGDFEAVRRIAQETKGGIAVAALARCRDGDPQRAVEAIGRRAAAPARVHRDQRHPPQAQAAHRRDEALAEAVRWVPTARRRWAATPRSSSPPRTPRAPTSSTCSRSTRPSSEAGASTVNIPDTVGYAIPAEFGALVGRSSRPGRREATVSVHCHNDLGLATANTLAAVQAGARQVEVTINGLGERAGNASWRRS